MLCPNLTDQMSSSSISDVVADPNAPAYQPYDAIALKRLDGTVHDIDPAERVVPAGRRAIRPVWRKPLPLLTRRKGRCAKSAGCSMQ